MTARAGPPWEPKRVGRCHASIKARHAPVGDQPECLAVEEEEVPNGGGAERKRALEDRVEDRIDGRRRARDDPEYGARRLLALQRLGDLLEQLRVPDGDGRLVGEALEGADLRGE